MGVSDLLVGLLKKTFLRLPLAFMAKSQTLRFLQNFPSICFACNATCVYCLFFQVLYFFLSVWLSVFQSLFYWQLVILCNNYRYTHSQKRDPNCTAQGLEVVPFGTFINACAGPQKHIQIFYIRDGHFVTCQLKSLTTS